MKKNSLKALLEPYQSIATIGLCKNAGKTTVLNSLVFDYYKNHVLGITSIGYDGEEEDLITHLPKPRVKVYPGMYVATCEQCLQKTQVNYKNVEDTGINTALGKVHIIQIQEEGIIEISGPSIVKQIDKVKERFFELSCTKVIIDGAAGRLSVGSQTQAAVLAVGAALNKEMNKVISKASYYTELLGLKKNAELIGVNRPVNEVYRVSRLVNEYIFAFRGAVVDEDVIKIMKHYKGLRKIILVKDATAIFVSPTLFHNFKQNSGLFFVEEEVRLVALTINPMSPYGEWFKEEDFLKEMENAVEIPVYNIVKEGENHEE